MFPFAVRGLKFAKTALWPEVKPRTRELEQMQKEHPVQATQAKLAVWQRTADGRAATRTQSVRGPRRAPLGG